MSSMGIGNKPCLDIRPSADQINDRSISVAQLSKSKYNSFLFENILVYVNDQWALRRKLEFDRTAPRFRNSIAVSTSEDSSRCSRRPHSVISVSSSSSSGGSSGPPTTLNLGLDTSPRPHHRSTTLNSQCSVGVYMLYPILSNFLRKFNINLQYSHCRKRYYRWYLNRVGRWRWRYWEESLEFNFGEPNVASTYDFYSSAIAN